MDGLDLEWLRIAFVVYGAMNRKDWRTVNADDVGGDAGKIENHLVPVIRSELLAAAEQEPGHWVERMIQECRERLGIVLPMSDTEIEFLDQLLDHGEIKPELLTADTEMRKRIKTHPLLHWKALNVRQYKGK